MPLRPAIAFPATAFPIIPFLAALVLLATPAFAQEGEVYSSQETDFRLVELARGLESPWSLAFLPEQGASGAAYLVTEQDGALMLVRGGDHRPIEGLPPIRAVGQGGLLDVALHPDFAENRLVYFTYAAEQGGGYATRLGRGRLAEDRQAIEDFEVLLETQSVTSTTRHFGSRIVFGQDGLLYMTVGDRGESDRAQDLSNHIGSVLRLTEEGAPAPGNPFLESEGALPEIYSYGHRNPQGLTVDPADGSIWAVEHGPRGGDELNLIRAGANYGWPVITYGVAYSGLPIGEGETKPGMEQPATYWVPSISPSGLMAYDGEAFPAWRGSLFAGALSGQLLVRLEREGDRVTGEERLLEDLGERIRWVGQGPDGLIYLLTDSSNGRLLRLEPA